MLLYRMAGLIMFLFDNYSVGSVVDIVIDDKTSILNANSSVLYILLNHMNGSLSLDPYGTYWLFTSSDITNPPDVRFDICGWHSSLNFEDLASEFPIFSAIPYTVLFRWIGSLEICAPISCD